MTPNPADIARRVMLHHAIDEKAHAIAHDTRGVDAVARLAFLTESLGDVACDVLRNGSCDLDNALLRLAAGAQLFLEDRAREAAR